MISVFLQVSRFFGLDRKVEFLQTQRGQLLIELLLAMGIAAILLPALVGGFITSRQGEAQQKLRTQGTVLFRETVEAARSVRERDWTTFAVNGTYHPVASGGAWEFESGSETVGEFTRQITIDDVYRNSEGAIVASGGVLDPSTKEVEVSVTWGSSIPSSIDETLYFTRHENMSYTETTEEQFNEGFLDGVAVVNNEDGEVILGSGGSGDWCTPLESIVEQLDLPKQGVANSMTAIEGEAFVGTGQNASGESLVDISISNTDPPQAEIIDTFDGYKTHDVFGENDYFYVATHRPNREVVIVDISSSPFEEVGYYNAPGGGEDDANGVFVVGNVGYAVVANKLFTFDLSDRSGKRSTFDEVSLSGTGTSIQVVGNYAYISVADSSQKMQIFDVSDPNNLIDVGFANIDSGNGKDVFVNESGTRAYVVTEESSVEEEFYIIDITDKSGNRPIIGNHDTSGMNPEGVTVVPGNRAIVVGHGGEEYQVLNIANEDSPAHCGGLDVDFNINGVQGVVEEDGDAYSYIITTESDSEFKVIEGGPGGGFSDEGVFESTTYEWPYSIAFNRFDVLFDKPNITNITFQIAVAEPVSGDCSAAEFDFVGPDGDSETFFADSAAIPFGVYGNYSNPGRCFRYKVFLDTDDSTTTPVFHEIVVNHSL